MTAVLNYILVLLLPAVFNTLYLPLECEALKKYLSESLAAGTILSSLHLSRDRRFLLSQVD